VRVEAAADVGAITKAVALKALNALGDVERVRVEAAADVGAIYYTLRVYVFRQSAFIGGDGELIPVLRKSFLGYGNAWRRELATFDLVPEDVEVPSLAEYLATRGNGTPAATPSALGGDPPEPVADDSSAPGRAVTR
jgi:hypothetical protein